MVTITFSDRETEKRALGFLIGRFSGRILRSGEHLVPEAALEALAEQNIPFMFCGKATYEQQMAALRGDSSASV
jgi:DNA-binding LacI/PurR family transcriptional regulator